MHSIDSQHSSDFDADFAASAHSSIKNLFGCLGRCWYDVVDTEILPVAPRDSALAAAAFISGL